MVGVERVQKWWKDAVVYQIYPASFCDSNGDGVGDIPGITAKLDYISNLGVDVIWVCPMYESPQVDMGYDISNYEDVHRPYGTVKDMETLISETHKKGMRIMLDLVINHTSDQHVWFQESRKDKSNAFRDWYIWRPAKFSPSGERIPPNNWRSNFGGGSVWEWDEVSQEYYLHLFAKEQPDLNWENDTTRRAIYKSSMEFWLERGVDGFRVDTVNMYSKPPGLPDAPITDPETTTQPAGLLYCNGPRMHEFLGEMNVILSKYEAITVGELPHTPDMSRVLKYVSAKERQLDMVFQFDVVDVGFGVTHKYETTPKNYTLPDLKAAIGRTQSIIRGTDAWTTVFMENHDQARSVSRFTDDRPEFRAKGAKLLALMQGCLSGTQYIYQGQEIGSVNAPKAEYTLENYLDIDSYLFLDLVKAKHGADNQEELDKAFDALQHLARDHARIPMAWSDGPQGGFSLTNGDASQNSNEPWMAVHPLASEINAASQMDDSNSVLAFWRRMLAFRREHPDLFVYGDYDALRVDDPHIYMFVKQKVSDDAAHSEFNKALVVLNFSPEERRWEPPSRAELDLDKIMGADREAVKLIPIMGTVEEKSQSEVMAPFEGRVYLVAA